MGTDTLQLNLESFLQKGSLYESLGEGKIRCIACAQRCVLREGQYGVCKIRRNHGGELEVPMGYVAGIQVDPIEKKPFYHVLPSAKALSFGMLGCNFKCAYCQNWLTSQALKEEVDVEYQPISAASLANLAHKHGAEVLTSTYNEPLITTEWALEVFAEARKLGIKCSYVSNGYATREVLELLKPYLTSYKIDLKSFRDKTYRTLKGRLDDVLNSIAYLHELGIWIELVTLIIPDHNDSEEELKEMADFIHSISKQIPWHLTAFHPDYKMTDRGRTPYESLKMAYDIGKKRGLEFVYIGNLPGVEEGNTYCPHCQSLLIKRYGFKVISNLLVGKSKNQCFHCKKAIPGVFI